MFGGITFGGAMFAAPILGFDVACTFTYAVDSEYTYRPCNP